MLKRIKYLCLVLILFPELINGQSLNFKQVDSASYQMYLQHDWEELEAYCKSAKKLGFDFYYLHLRMAIAQLYNEDYFAAKKSLLHAQSKKPFSSVLKPLFSQSAYLADHDLEYQSYLIKDSLKSFRLKSIEVSLSNFNKDEGLGPNDLDGEADVYGEYLSFNRLNDFSIALEILAFQSWKMHILYHKMVGSGEHYFAYNNQTKSQAYNLSLDQSAFKLTKYFRSDFYFTFFGGLSSTSKIAYEANYDSLTFTYNAFQSSYDSIEYYYTIEGDESQLLDYSLGTNIQKRWPYWHLKIGLNYNYIFNKSYWQSAQSISLFPFGSYKHFLHLNFNQALHDKNINLNGTLKLQCGLTKKLSVIGHFALGHFNGMQQYEASYIYNRPDSIIGHHGLGLKYNLGDKIDLSLYWSQLKCRQTHTLFVHSGYNEYNFPTFELDTRLVDYQNKLIQLSLKYRL